MDKQKLVQIIIKDLDELKNLSEEVAEIQDDVTLIVDLALSKARLLCQEIDLLHEYSGKPKNLVVSNQEIPEEIPEEVDAEVSYSDPELEILNFEVPDLEEEAPDEAETSVVEEPEEHQETENDQQDESFQEEVVLETVEEDNSEEDIEEDNNEEDAPDTELEEPENNKQEPEIAEEEDDQEVIVYDEDTDEEDEDSNLEAELEAENEVQVTELENESQSEVREIHIDDLDDEDADSFKFAPVSGSSGHPVMHEIPKPENAPKEKQVVGETFHKERSLNDVMGENKSGESKLTNGPISSLRASIGLNDRFLFIREIFDNNSEKYNTIIDQLDKLETIQQAVEYLKANLSLEKNETSMKFVDLLKRRFNK